MIPVDQPAEWIVLYAATHTERQENCARRTALVTPTGNAATQSRVHRPSEHGGATLIPKNELGFQ
jgi:hypothetical protein